MDRTLLVTGSATGIGRATARGFTDRGWTVWATDPEPDEIVLSHRRDARRMRWT